MTVGQPLCDSGGDGAAPFDETIEALEQRLLVALRSGDRVLAREVLERLGNLHLARISESADGKQWA